MRKGRAIADLKVRVKRIQNKKVKIDGRMRSKKEKRSFRDKEEMNTKINFPNAFHGHNRAQRGFYNMDERNFNKYFDFILFFCKIFMYGTRI